tara:strand:- start:238 stop:492 length:255 start_codon:yes stop_codon:yes gene_type:complete
MSNSSNRKQPQSAQQLGLLNTDVSQAQIFRTQGVALHPRQMHRDAAHVGVANEPAESADQCRIPGASNAQGSAAIAAQDRIQSE